MKEYNILAINPGSTSTKIAVYKGREEVMELTLRHSSEELAPYASVIDQFAFRKDVIVKAVAEAGIDIKTIDVVIGRGGLVKPIQSGVYEVNDALKRDLKDNDLGEHASNLGGLIADDIARELGVKAYIADPVVVDELQDVARITGHPLLPKVSVFHALNHKAIARQYAESIGKRYEDLRLIVAHLGGGISVGAHLGGKVIDVNNALDGDGPYSPERAGTVPAGALAKLCFSGEYTHAQVKKMLTGAGGVVAYLGLNDMREVRKMIDNGDKKATEIHDGMAYGVAKYIGSMAVVLEGKVDAIILTGGIAHGKETTSYVSRMVSFIAPVVIIPGENEMQALAVNALRVALGEVQPSVYR